MLYYTSCEPRLFYFKPVPNQEINNTFKLLSLGGWPNLEGDIIWTPDGQTYYLSGALISDLALGIGTDFNIITYKFDNKLLKWIEIGNIFPPMVIVDFIDDSNFWTDGEDIYFTSESNPMYRFDKDNEVWVRDDSYTQGIPDIFYPESTWTDGKNIYYSRYDIGSFILNKSEKKWEPITWEGAPERLYTTYFWTDGTQIFYSNGSQQYRVDIENRIFHDLGAEVWYDSTSGEYLDLHGEYIWTDGYHVYYTPNSSQTYRYARNGGYFTQWNKLFSSEGYSIRSNLRSNGTNWFYNRSVLVPSTAKLFYRDNDTWKQVPVGEGNLEIYNGEGRVE